MIELLGILTVLLVGAAVAFELWVLAVSSKADPVSAVFFYVSSAIAMTATGTFFYTVLRAA